MRLRGYGRGSDCMYAIIREHYFNIIHFLACIVDVVLTQQYIEHIQGRHTSPPVTLTLTR